MGRGMTREDLLKSAEYWEAKAQIDLYECALRFMEKNGLDKQGLARHLGIPMEDVEILLNGDFYGRLYDFIGLALALGYVPKIEFEEIESVIREDKKSGL